MICSQNVFCAWGWLFTESGNPMQDFCFEGSCCHCEMEVHGGAEEVQYLSTQFSYISLSTVIFAKWHNFLTNSIITLIHLVLHSQVGYRAEVKGGELVRSCLCPVSFLNALRTAHKSCRCWQSCKDDGWERWGGMAGAQRKKHSGSEHHQQWRRLGWSDCVTFRRVTICSTVLVE